MPQPMQLMNRVWLSASGRMLKVTPKKSLRCLRVRTAYGVRGPRRTSFISPGPSAHISSSRPCSAQGSDMSAHQPGCSCNKGWAGLTNKACGSNTRTHWVTVTVHPEVCCAVLCCSAHQKLLERCSAPSCSCHSTGKLCLECCSGKHSPDACCHTRRRG